MLNALRLNDGFELTLFADRTGQDIAAVEETLRINQQRGLLEIEQGRVKASELGRRFLDSLVSEFFPD